MSYLENVQNKRNLERELQKSESSKGVFRKKFDKDYIEIILMGDEHIGSPQYKKDLHQKVLESSFNKGRYLIHMGDGMETATRNSIGAGVYQQEEIIDQQMNEFKALYEPFVEEGLFIGGHPGNHELRIYNDEGLNLTKQIYRSMNARYFGIAKASVFRVGNQTYTFYSTHGASGARLPHTKIKGALDMEKIIDVDIYCMGHVHQLMHHVRNYNDIDLKKTKIKTNSKHFILTGSYLDYWDSYAQMKNMEPSRIGSPILKLYGGEEKRVKVSLQ